MNLLIVNADDWGMDQETTDAIHACFLAGGITSVTAMVHMADSARAAALALEGGEPVGLHLNLTEAFTDAACPDDVRRRQRHIVGYFAGPRRRRWGFSPTMFREVGACVAEQLEEFRRLYGRDPTHVDGHEHVHQALTVLFSTGLPRGMRMRPSFTFLPGEKSPANRLARQAVNQAMRARFRCPRYFFSIRDMHPALGGAGLEHKLGLSDRAAVEVMTHPGWSDERDVLSGDGWAGSIRGRRLGAYSDLGQG